MTHLPLVAKPLATSLPIALFDVVVCNDGVSKGKRGQRVFCFEFAVEFSV